MIDFFAHLWFWLLSCLIVGVATGLLIQRAPRRGGIARWLLWGALAFTAGVITTALGAAAGGVSQSIESALASFAAFIVGAAGGTLAAGGSLRQHEGWALGLIPAALIWFGATLFAQPAYQDELKRKVGEAAERLGADASGVVILGRDVAAPQALTDNAQALAEIANIPGVRRVVAADDGGGHRQTSSERKPADTPAPAPAPVAAGAPIAPDQTTPAPVSAPAPADAPAPIAAKGDLDAANCRVAIAAILAHDPVQFRSGGVAIRLAAARILDKVAVALRQCPGAKVEVGGHTDTVGDEQDNRELSQRRADAVARYLQREGVARERLSAVGYGAARPKAPNDDESGRAENRGVEFVVK